MTRVPKITGLVISRIRFVGEVFVTVRMDFLKGMELVKPNLASLLKLRNTVAVAFTKINDVSVKTMSFTIPTCGNASKVSLHYIEIGQNCVIYVKFPKNFSFSRDQHILYTTISVQSVWSGLLPNHFSEKMCMSRLRKLQSRNRVV